ncbi:MAG: hypothetical protein DRN37_03225 [Thermoplasmata archaeon]|nr:MAG: hypothetical protein DRN37_03225 [Thermoplasmata archaeon]
MSSEVKEKTKGTHTKERLYVDRALLKGDWTECPSCGERVKSVNLGGHIRKVHKLEMVHGTEKSNLVPLVILVILIVIISSVGIYFLSRGNSDGGGKGSSGPPEDGWLDDCIPVHDTGSGEDDWWIVYPDDHPDWGTDPDHPDWVLERLGRGPILILDHSDNCIPCLRQQEDVDSIMEYFGDDILLIDLLSGQDERASEVFGVYDPGGPPNYIPLSVIITLVKDVNGEVKIGWHSVEGATGEEWLTEHVKDAIYYHRENIDEWK